VPRYYTGLEEKYIDYRAEESYKVLQTASFKEVGNRGYLKETTGFYYEPTNAGKKLEITFEK